MRGGRRIGHYALYGLSLVVGPGALVITLPYLVRVAGVGPWSVIAVSQSVGALAAVLISGGWAFLGPPSVGRLEPQQRSHYFGQTIWARGWLAVCVTPLLAACVLLLTPTGDLAVDLLLAAASASGALGATWYYIGIASPGLMFWTDTVPRSAGVILATALMLWSGSVLVYAIVFFGSCCLTVVIPILLIKPFGTSVREPYIRGPITNLRLVLGQKAAISTALTGALYVNAPLLIVSTLAPAGLPAYALADKIYRFSQNALSPVTQVAQGLATGGPRELRRRYRASIPVILVAAGAAGVGYAVALPVLGTLIAGDAITLAPLYGVGFGLAFGAMSVSRVVGYAYLFALDRAKAVAVSTVTGSAIGLGLVLLLTPTAGVVYASIGVAAAELTVTLLQLRVLIVATRDGDERPSTRSTSDVAPIPYGSPLPDGPDQQAGREVEQTTRGRPGPGAGAGAKT